MTIKKQRWTGRDSLIVVCLVVVNIGIYLHYVQAYSLVPNDRWGDVDGMRHLVVYVEHLFAWLLTDTGAFVYFILAKNPCGLWKFCSYTLVMPPLYIANISIILVVHGDPSGVLSLLATALEIFILSYAQSRVSSFYSGRRA